MIVVLAEKRAFDLAFANAKAAIGDVVPPGYFPDPKVDVQIKNFLHARVGVILDKLRETLEESNL